MDSTRSTSENDAVLMDGLRAGDRACAESLTQRYWPAINRFCLSYLSDDQLAEDVTQDTFAKLIPDGDLPAGDVKPWLYKVARNRCLDILRRHQRSPTHHRQFRTGFDAPLASSGPQTKAARQERQRLIRDIVSSMPEDYRSVLTLKHFEGLSRAEIAESLGVTETVVKGRLVRASEYLREQLRQITGSSS